MAEWVRSTWERIACPTLEGEGERQRQYILHVVLVVLALPGLLFGLINLALWLTGRGLLLGAAVGLGVQPFYLLAYRLARRGHLRWATWIVPTLLLGAMGAATVWIGIGHSTLIGLALVVTTAGVLLGVSQAVAFAVVSTSVYWALGLLQAAGLLPRPLAVEATVPLDVVAVGLGLISLVGLNWLTAREIARAMKRRAEVENIRRQRDSARRLVRLQSDVISRIRDQLLRREKLAFLGQMAGIVGHELRNPLGVISNAAYYLNAVSGVEDPKAREYLALIGSEVKRATQIVNELLDFGRMRPPERSPTSLRDLLGSVLLHHPAPEGIDVRVESPDPDVEVSLDAAQMLQVVDNLLENAYDAVRDRAEETADSTYQPRVRLRADRRGAQVVIGVEDNGGGIAPDIRAPLFEPLVTSKPHGIGLGLALAKMIVEGHGGEIRVESQGNEGSHFEICLTQAEVGA